MQIDVGDESLDFGALQTAYSHLTGAIFILDENQHCIFMNAAAVALTGYTVVEISRRPLHEVLHHTKPDGSHEPLSPSLVKWAFMASLKEQGQDTFVHKDGHLYHITYTASRMTEGRFTGTIMEVRDISEEFVSRQTLEDEARRLETLNRTGAMLAGTLDLEEIVQAVTDAATDLSGAQFGAFFYNTVREGKALQLYTLSGAPRDAFSSYPKPQHTDIFGPTFAQGEILRIDNVSQDPRYGQFAPFYGMPAGHLPVSSYLSIPVISRTGDILGALIFGHEKSGVFTEKAEHIVKAIAAQASIAIDNAHLYEAAQREILERQRSEEHQKLLVAELNHRVKNMLATVQSIAKQSLKGSTDATAMHSFQGRLLALSHSHSLIMQTNWRTVDLKSVASAALSPFLGDTAGDKRVVFEGRPIQLTPKIALALGMAFHELTVNAAKYGALLSDNGHVEITWHDVDMKTLCISWEEKNGPPVHSPERTGFGTRLLMKGLAHEIGGDVRMHFEDHGLICEIDVPMAELAA